MKEDPIEPSEAESVQILRNLHKRASLLIKHCNRPENLFVLRASKSSFVIIDMQNFSCAPAMGEAWPRISEVIAQINRVAEFCRKMGVPVIWVRQNIAVDETGTNAGLFPMFHDRRHVKSMCNLGKGTEIFPEMHVEHYVDHIVFKNRYSAFLSNPPELQEKLNYLGRTQLIVAGIAANVCVESTVRDAMQMDYEVVLISDGVTSFDETLLEITLVNTRLFFGDVRTAEEVMEALRENAP